MERMNLFQDNNKPQITFYFAECMEFPNYGEYKEFPTLAQAISLFEKCPGNIKTISTSQCEILNGSIFRSSEYVSGSYELRHLTQGTSLRSSLFYFPVALKI